LGGEDCHPEEKRMKRIARILLAAAIVGFAPVAPSGAALAAGRSGTGGLPTPEYSWGFGWGYYGKGPVFSGQYATATYDGYFAYDYPVYIGGDVTATAVDLVNSRFRHRRAVGPGVVYYRSEYPRPSRVNSHW
jgi:hypothetical protein